MGKGGPESLRATSEPCRLPEAELGFCCQLPVCCQWSHVPGVLQPVLGSPWATLPPVLFLGSIYPFVLQLCDLFPLPPTFPCTPRPPATAVTSLLPAVTSHVIDIWLGSHPPQQCSNPTIDPLSCDPFGQVTVV